MIKQSKQDKTYSRTAEDLERKYNLGQFAQGSNSKEVKELKSDIDNLSYRVKDLEESGGGSGSGKDGVSVLSVKQTTTSTEDGGTNVITCTLSDGTKSNFNIMNGNKGSDGTDGKSAYQYAQEGGYEGTESEFSEKMAEDVDVDIDYSKIEFDTEEIVVEPSSSPSNLDILDTMTEIEANTENGKIAGALAVKELSESLGGLRFGYDGDSNTYGYYGADDSFIPFKTTEVVLLGTATSYNISDIVGAENIGKYTVDDFICASGIDNLVSYSSGVLDGPKSGLQFSKIRDTTITYDSTTGNVTVNPFQIEVIMGLYNSNWTYRTAVGTTITATVKVYLVVK